SATARWRPAGAAPAGAAAQSCLSAAVDPQCPEGKVLRVEVILEVEDARESRPVPEPVLPRAVAPLRPAEVFDAALDGAAARAPGREEAEQSPGRLAGRRLADPSELGVGVALARLAPAPVTVLVTLEPAHRSLDVFVTQVLADRAEPAEDGPGAVDVVPPRGAVPGAVVPLRVTEEVERTLRRLESAPVPKRAEELEAAPGQVLRRRVEQGAVVGERNVVEVEAVVVGIERRPAPVLALHAEEPAEPALLRQSHGVPVEPADLLERHQDHRGVVEVRVEVVVVLERPAAGPDVGPLHLPVTRDEDLATDEPLDRTLAERTRGEALPDLEAVVHGDEDVLPEELPPAERLGHAREAEARLLPRLGPELVQREVRRQPLHRLPVHDDQERDDHRPRP